MVLTTPLNLASPHFQPGPLSISSSFSNPCLHPTSPPTPLTLPSTVYPLHASSPPPSPHHLIPFPHSSSLSISHTKTSPLPTPFPILSLLESSPHTHTHTQPTTYKTHHLDIKEYLKKNETIEKQRFNTRFRYERKEKR